MMVDLSFEVDNHIDGFGLLSIDSNTLVKRHTKAYLVILVAEIDEEYKLMPLRNDDNSDSDFHGDEENLPMVSVKRSVADSI